MGRKIVGITCSTLPGTADSGPRQALNRAYVYAVEQAGGIPVILPVTADADVARRYLGMLDGLLLSGGVDVAPNRYGEEPHPALGTVDADRDLTEEALLCEALAQDMPVFAICRGIQMLNVALGGTLYQDLPAQRPTTLQHQQSSLQLPRDAMCHSIEVERETKLSEIVGAGQMQTNSFHHQALNRIADGLIVTARTPDGIIEAVERPASRYLVGVQFHPEETAPNDDKSRRLFKAFIDAM